MDEWRLKLLKNLQYTCELGAWALAARARSHHHAQPLPVARAASQLARIATLVSLSRRSMSLGDWLGRLAEARDLIAAGGADEDPLLLASLLGGAVSDIADNVSVWMRLCVWRGRWDAG